MVNFKVGDKVYVRDVEEFRGRTYKIVLLQGTKAGIEEINTSQQWIVPVKWLY